jgi:hypothetical protein
LLYPSPTRDVLKSQPASTGLHHLIDICVIIHMIYVIDLADLLTESTTLYLMAQANATFQGISPYLAAQISIVVV